MEGGADEVEAAATACIPLMSLPSEARVSSASSEHREGPQNSPVDGVDLASEDQTNCDDAENAEDIEGDEEDRGLAEEGHFESLWRVGARVKIGWRWKWTRKCDASGQG